MQINRKAPPSGKLNFSSINFTGNTGAVWAGFLEAVDDFFIADFGGNTF